MTLVVGAGALLFLHQLPVGVVVSCATQLQILLLHWVGRHLLDGQPVQRLLSGHTRKEETFIKIVCKKLGRILTWKSSMWQREAAGCRRWWEATPPSPLPLLARDLLRFGTPSHRHQSQVVQPVVHCHGVDVDDLKTGCDAASVLLPTFKSEVKPTFNNSIKLRWTSPVYIFIIRRFSP